LHYKLGLTDLAKLAHGRDADLDKRDFDASGFMAKITMNNPTFVAFNGKPAAEQVLRRKTLDWGFQPDRIGRSRVWVLPSTASWPDHWDERHWQALADAVLQLGMAEPQ
jgi:TDG/mug DNA glycosylase family protein